MPKARGNRFDIDETEFMYYKIEQQIENEFVSTIEIPEYLVNNLSPRFIIRDYQRKAFRNFIIYLEDNRFNHNKQSHLLFHMATGAGKTYIMAGAIIYLFKKGYRNFLFFVNSNNIIEKTKDNFLSKNSLKYLFTQDIIINNEKVEIKEVDNFQDIDDKAINIKFTTIQHLHRDLNKSKEGAITIEDLNDKKIILIADEAHHINSDTKKKLDNNRKVSENEKEEYESWERLVNSVFRTNKDNILLEFTATCDLRNENILEKYKGNPAEIIFNYPLLQFRESGFTKDFFNIQTGLNPLYRTVQAMLLSQYRLKLFEEYGIANQKPVILLKSDSIPHSEEFFNYFIDFMQNHFSSEALNKVRLVASGIVKEMFDFYEKENITDDILVQELKQAFSEVHLIIMNSQDDASKEKQKLVNDLESPKNPYRMIFTVDMLNEGWDVLNLFDIVRLYDTRQTGRSKLSKVTISEAQLIGRGVRYNPFKINEFDDAYKRKFDSDLENELRVCETLYYHSKEDSKYIDELRRALKQIGFEADTVVKFTYRVKDKFKEDDLYKHGKLFVNTAKKKDRRDIISIPGNFNIDMEVDLSLTKEKTLSLVTDERCTSKNKDELITSIFKIKNIDRRIVLKALRKFPVMKFNILKSYFPQLKSITEFICSNDYAGKYELSLITNSIPTNVDIYNGVIQLFEKLSDKILAIKEEYYGTKQFIEIPFNKCIKDTPRQKSNPDSQGEGISQNADTVHNDFRYDLSDKDWFVYNDNYGTTEEKRFVKYFASKVDELKKKYEKVYLIRNERNLHIFSFRDGLRFEPDYILLLANKNAVIEQQQIFIEPKGQHLRKQDKWKEDFLLELENNAEAIAYHDDGNKYKIIGLPFYTHNEELQKFKDEFEKLL